VVVSIENEKGEKLASALIKQLTGGDRMAARFLYKEHFEFETTFKIFLIANDKPKIRGEDSAMWERIKLVPFQQFIPVKERDKDIGEKLKEEAEGILAWMVKGCLEWLKHGDLLEPDIVTAETKIYRDEMDILGDFLDDCCIVDKKGKVAVSDLHKAYEKWCEQNEEELLTKRTFHDELTSRQFFTKRGIGGKKIWHGLSLNSDASDVSTPVSVNSL
jgi:putative DNA primase/helicase